MRAKLITVLLIALPALAFAQEVVRSFDLVTPPDSGVLGVAHIEDIKIADRRQIRAVVTTNEGSGELTFDGRTIRMGDGYTVVRETLANTPGALVVRLTASAPDGSSAAAIIVSNPETGEVSAVGLERYSRLLHGSHDVHFLNQVLPLVVATPHQGRHAGAASFTSTTSATFMPAPLAFLDCAGASLAFASATLGLELACASQVPGACEIAIGAWLSALSSFASSCPSTSYDDGTIGWA